MTLSFLPFLWMCKTFESLSTILTRITDCIIPMRYYNVDIKAGCFLTTEQFQLLYELSVLFYPSLSSCVHTLPVSFHFLTHHFILKTIYFCFLWMYSIDYLCYNNALQIPNICFWKLKSIHFCFEKQKIQAVEWKKRPQGFFKRWTTLNVTITFLKYLMFEMLQKM